MGFGTWTSRAALLASKMAHGGAGSSLLAVLAISGSASVALSDVSASTFHFDGVAWRTEASVNQARSNTSAAGQVNSTILVGGVGLSQSPSSEQYDGVAWTTQALPVTQRTAPVVLGTPGTAQLVGGYDTSGFSLASTERWNSVSWLTSAVLNVNRGAPFGAGSGTYHRIAGGFYVVQSGNSLSTRYLADQETYNAVVYSAQTPGLVSGQFSGGASQQGTSSSMVLFGGVDENGNLTAKTQVFNGATWAADTAMLAIRRYPGGSGTGQAAFATGGQPVQSNTGLTSTESYASTNQFTPLGYGQSSVVVLNPNRALAYGNVQGKIITFGNQVFGRAQAQILGVTKQAVGQAQTSIRFTGVSSWIVSTSTTNSYTTGASAGDRLAAQIAAGDANAVGGSPSEIWNNIAWSNVARGNISRQIVLGTGLQNSMLAIGGNVGGLSSLAVERFNGVTWITEGSLNIQRAAAGGVGTVGDSIATKGQDIGPSTNLASTEYFDGVTWTRLADANGPDRGAACAGTTQQFITVSISASVELYTSGVRSSLPLFLYTPAGNCGGSKLESNINLAIFWGNIIGGGSAALQWNGLAWVTDSYTPTAMTNSAFLTSGAGSNAGGWSVTATGFFIHTKGAITDPLQYGQALAIVNQKLQAGQAVAQIKGYLTVQGQAQAQVVEKGFSVFGQANAFVSKSIVPTAGAAAWVANRNTNVLGQANARLITFGNNNSAGSVALVTGRVDTSYPKAILADGPIAYWRMDETNGLIYSDVSATIPKHQATLSGSFTQGVAGGALFNESDFAAQFLGSASSLTGGTLKTLISADLKLTTGNFTFECWIFPTDSGNSHYRHILGTYPAGGGAGYALFLSNAAGAGAGALGLFGNGTNNLFTTYVPPLNKWTHIVFSVAAGTATVYANGVQVATGAQSNPTSSTGNFSIGQSGDYTTDSYFAGSIDEVAVYNVALSGAQALAHFQAATKQINVTGQANADIKATVQAFGQALTSVNTKWQTGQAAARLIGTQAPAFGQANADITATSKAFGQANADIKATQILTGQAQADIKTTTQAFGQANAIINQKLQTGQAQAQIKLSTFPVTGQAQADVRATYLVQGQAQATVANLDFVRFAANVVGTTTDYVLLAANVNQKNNLSYVRLLATLQSFPKLGVAQSNALIAAVKTDYIQLAATVNASVIDFVFLAANVQTQARDYVRLLANVSVFKGGTGQAQAQIQAIATDYVQLQANVQAQAIDFVRLQATVRNATQKVPGDGGTVTPIGSSTPVEDFLSNQIAAGVYSSYSQIILDGQTLLVTSFRPNVLSFQTRAKPWLNVQDTQSGGKYSTTSTQTVTNPSGQVETVTTVTTNEPDKVTKVETRTVSGTPTQTNTTVRQQLKNGRESQTDTTTVFRNGVAHTVERKTLHAVPPNKENRQPIKLKTLDGLTHYQWYGDNPNTDWAAGDALGTTETITDETMTPNPDGTVTKSVHQQILKPTGEQTDLLTETTSVDPTLGTTTKQTDSEFTGSTVKKTELTTLPNGQQVKTISLTQFNGDDSVTNETETVTDPFGQVTTTVTQTEVVRTATGTTTTITRSVTVGGVTKTTTTVNTDTNFEDAIAKDKVKVFLINEFAITAIMEEPLMKKFFDRAKAHQMSYALQELYNQKLSGNRLSYAFRQSLIKLYNQAIAMLAPITLQVFGNTYNVVFASSSSAFVPEYLATEPHIYRVQFVLQERTDLTTSQ